MIRNKFFEEGSSGGYASIKAPKNFDLMWKKILAFEEKSGLSLDSPLTKDQYVLMFNSMRIRHVTTFFNYKSLLMTYIRFLIANDALPSEQEDVLASVTVDELKINEANGVQYYKNLNTLSRQSKTLSLFRSVTILPYTIFLRLFCFWPGMGWTRKRLSTIVKSLCLMMD